MIWIKKIILENFQSHKYTELEFLEGLNAIVGSTDSGKTAIFRAIKWALYNEPQGDYFIREGEDYVSVKIEFNTGVIVNRYRKKRINGYEITYPNGEVMVFEGFGTKVPEEVLEATRMKKINFTKTEDRSINMAEQLDAPFLLSETSSLKAAAIGKLVQADLVDHALVNTNADLRNKKRDLLKSQKDLEDLDLNLKNYEYLENLKEKIVKLEEIQNLKIEKELRLEKLINLKISYLKVLENKIKYSEVIKNLQGIEDTKEIYLNAENLLNKNLQLTRIKENYNNILKRKDYLEKILLQLREISKIDNIFWELENKNNRLNSLLNISNRQKLILNRKNKIENIYKKLKDINIAEEIYTNINRHTEIYNRINLYHRELKTLEKRINTGNIYMDKLKNIEISEEKTLIIREKLEKIKKLLNINNPYKRVKTNINNNLLEIKSLEKKIEVGAKEYESILKNLKICPTCNRPLDINDKSDLMKHIME